MPRTGAPLPLPTSLPRWSSADAVLLTRAWIAGSLLISVVVGLWRSAGSPNHSYTGRPRPCHR
jgi:hypothetical protein